MEYFVKATYVNDTRGYTVHIEEPAETPNKSLSEMYKSIRRLEKGRITKMYIDGKDGKAIHVGYCVTRQQKYDDSNETYTETVWFELLTKVKVMREVNEFKALALLNQGA